MEKRFYFYGQKGVITWRTRNSG